MKPMSTLCAAAVAVVCLGGVEAATAAAYEGAFVNTAEETLVKNKLTAKSGEVKVVTVGGATIACTASTSKGSMPNASEGEATITFMGCASSGLSCKGGGASKAGEIIALAVLRTRDATQPEGEVLLLLQILATGVHELASEAKPLEITCSGVAIKLYGSFLVKGGGLKKLKTTWTFTAEQEKGVQKPLEYESEEKAKVKDMLKANVGGSGWEQAGIAATDETTFEEAMQEVELPVINFHRVNFPGMGTLTLTRIILGVEKTYGTAVVAPEPPFSITKDTCKGTSFAPIGICQVEVVYTPTKAGEEAEGLLQIPYEETKGLKEKWISKYTLRGHS